MIWYHEILNFTVVKTYFRLAFFFLMLAIIMRVLDSKYNNDNLVKIAKISEKTFSYMALPFYTFYKIIKWIIECVPQFLDILIREIGRFSDYINKLLIWLINTLNIFLIDPVIRILKKLVEYLIDLIFEAYVIIEPFLMNFLKYTYSSFIEIICNVYYYSILFYNFIKMPLRIVFKNIWFYIKILYDYVKNIAMSILYWMGIISSLVWDLVYSTILNIRNKIDIILVPISRSIYNTTNQIYKILQIVLNNFMEELVNIFLG